MMESRRGFIKKAFAGALGFSVLPNWVSGASVGPNSKLNVALVGCGGRGDWACQDMCTCDRVNPVAFCDVNSDVLAHQNGKFPGIANFSDYRVMLDKMDKDIDAVVISTPDHTHYPISAWAMAMGKHVFVEKPLSRTVWEGREIKRIAQKQGVVTQLGNHGRSMPQWMEVKEWYDAGLLGEVKEIHIWTDRPVWRQGPLERPDGSEPVPPNLDYKLWLNVAPDAPYSSQFVPFHWRGLRDYGTGAMGDHACHAFDWVYGSLDLGMPVKIKGDSSEFNDYGWPVRTHVEFEFPARGSRPPIKMYWYDASVKPQDLPRIPQEVVNSTPNGSAIMGTKETVICFDQHGAGTMISPRERMVELKKAGALPPPTIPRIGESHHRNFVTACMDGKKASSDVASYSADLNELVLLGCIPIFFPGQELLFDADRREFSNAKEANGCFNSRYAYKGEFLPGKI